jgi:ribonuclease HII
MSKGPHLKHEQSCDGIVCGIDEAGRAPLAGPVVAACVHIPVGSIKHRFWAKVRDSKKVPAELRAELFILITENACYGIAEATVEEIDTLNIHHANLLAMRRAQDNMMRHYGIVPNLTLVDGKFVPKDLPCPGQAIIGGDDISRSIAAASILAKVTRDRLMHALHPDHPHYGWDRNVGYPTPEHIRALRQHGFTRHHRKSFGVVKELLQAELALSA